MLWTKIRGSRPPNPKKAERREKLMNKVRKFGVPGVAFLTPIFLTVPVGTIISDTIQPSKLKVFPYMLVAFCFWAGLTLGLYHVSGVDVNEWLKSIL